MSTRARTAAELPTLSPPTGQPPEPFGASGSERVIVLLAMPETASAKSVLAIETVVELEYGAIESRPPVGSPASAVTVNAAGAEATPALFTALTAWAPPPVLEASKATATALPLCTADTKPLSV